MNNIYEHLNLKDHAMHCKTKWLRSLRRKLLSSAGLRLPHSPAGIENIVIKQGSATLTNSPLPYGILDSALKAGFSVVMKGKFANFSQESRISSAQLHLFKDNREYRVVQEGNYWWAVPKGAYNPDKTPGTRLYPQLTHSK